MNVKRFTARTSREALRQVREALGEDAVVLSTKPAGAGVEGWRAPEGKPLSSSSQQDAAAGRNAPSAPRI